MGVSRRRAGFPENLDANLGWRAGMVKLCSQTY
jgi:hypothetical protein